MKTSASLASIGIIFWLGGCAAGPTTGMAVRVPDGEEERVSAERMRQIAQPGPEHDQLARLSGTWEVTTTFRSSEPGARETLTEGEARNTVLIGGRFLRSEIRETWGGEPVDAVVRLGFDRRTGLHTLSRCDSWGTYCVDAAGAASEDGLLVLEGSALDPLGRDTETYRFVIDLRAPDRYSIAIDFMIPGGEVLTMTRSTFTRR